MCGGRPCLFLEKNLVKFGYSAKNEVGERVIGDIEASNREAARSKLKKQRWTNIRLKLQTEPMVVTVVPLPLIQSSARQQQLRVRQARRALRTRLSFVALGVQNGLEMDVALQRNNFSVDAKGESFVERYCATLSPLERGVLVVAEQNQKLPEALSSLILLGASEIGDDFELLIAWVMSIIFPLGKKGQKNTGYVARNLALLYQYAGVQEGSTLREIVRLLEAGESLANALEQAASSLVSDGFIQIVRQWEDLPRQQPSVVFLSLTKSFLMAYADY